MKKKNFMSKLKMKIKLKTKITLVKKVIWTGYLIKKRQTKLGHELEGQHPLQPHPCMINLSMLKVIGLR